MWFGSGRSDLVDRPAAAADTICARGEADAKYPPREEISEDCYARVAPEIGVLPSRDRLLSAIAGHLSDAPELLSHARELGDLHSSLIPGTVDANRRAELDVYTVRASIAEHEAAINSWAMFRLPKSPGARLHTHSLGDVISHVARTYAEVWWLMRHTEGRGKNALGERQLEAWYHLAAVIDGYADLIEAVHNRQVQLPLGWVGIHRRRPPDTATNTIPLR